MVTAELINGELKISMTDTDLPEDYDLAQELERRWKASKYAKDGFVVVVNSDTTEGRGYLVPFAITATETTAIRLAKGRSVQGSDGEVRQVPILSVGDWYYGPVDIIPPTEEDRKNEERRKKMQIIYDKCKVAGLTKEELDLLKKD